MMLTSGVIQDGVIQEDIVQEDIVQDDVIQDTQDGNSGKLPSEQQYESLDDSVSMWNSRYGRPNDLIAKQNKLKEEVDA